MPIGPKRNTSFLINNGLNFERRLASESSVYFDDCGQWKSGSSNVCYLGKFDDGFKLMPLKDGKFFAKSGNNLQELKTVPTEFIKIRHYQCSLLRDPSFRKKITQCISFKGSFSPSILKKCFVQYTGEPNIERSRHKNSLIKNSVYVRTDPEVISKVKQELKTECPKKVYVENVVDKAIESQPRDLRQLYNCKKGNESSGISSKTNIADDIQKLISEYSSAATNK